MADELPSFTIDEIPDIVADERVKALPSAEREQFIEHALGTAHADLTREGPLSAEDHANFRRVADHARQQVAPGWIESGVDWLKQVPSTLGGMAKDIVAPAAGAALAVGGSASIDPAEGLMIPPSQRGEKPNLEVAETLAGAAVNAMKDRAAAASQWMNANNAYGTDAGDYRAEPTTGQNLDKALEAVKRGLDSGAHLNEGDGTFAGASKALHDALAAYHADTNAPGALTDPQNAMLLNAYAATGNPGAWKQLRANLLKTGFKASTEEERKQLAESPGAQQFDATFGKGASEHLINGMDPVLLAATGLPLLRGAGAIGKGMGAFGKAADFAAQQTAFGVDAALRQNPDASAGDVAASVANMAALGGVMHGAGALVKGGANLLSRNAGSPARPVASPADTVLPRVPGAPDATAAAPESTPSPAVSPPPPEPAAPPEASPSSPEYPRVPAGDQAPYEGVTSIKNAVVDQERAARGLPPLMQPARKAWGTAWDEAGKMLDENPQAGVTLVDEINTRARPLTDTENALLLQHKLSVQHSINKAVETLNDPAADEGAKASARLALAQHNAALDAVDNAGKAGGTELGRGLNARKMLAGDDEFYSLPSMLAREQAMKGEPLTPREIDEVQARAGEIAQARAAMLAHDDAVAEREAHEGTVRIIDDLKQEAAAKPAEVAADVEAETRSTLEQQRAEVLARMQERRVQQPRESARVSESEADHGYNLAQPSEETRAQIELGIQTFGKHWGEQPGGDIAVREDVTLNSTEHGKFSGSREPGKSWIAIKPGAPDMHFVMVHEMAHQFDFRSGHGRSFSSENPSGPMKMVMRVLNSGETSKALNRSVRDWKGVKATTDFMRKRKAFIEYLDAPEERFARAVEQATRLKEGAPLVKGLGWLTEAETRAIIPHLDHVFSERKSTAERVSTTASSSPDFGRGAAPVDGGLVRDFSGRTSASAGPPRRAPLEEAAQKARERQKERRKRAHADPFGVMLAADLADAAIIGAYHIANGAVKFAEWSKRMVADFGDAIKPHLDSLFKNAQKHHDDTKRSIAEKVRTEKAPPSADVIVNNAAAAGKVEPKTITALARAHLLGGAKTLKDLLDKVHADAQKIAPDITRREVQDALSGYGKTSEPSKKQIDVQLREMKAQARLTSAYEDATKGKAPLRTGFQRGKPSDKVRELGRAVKDAMRKMGIVTTSKEKQLASALDAVKTRLRNQIADLTEQLKTGAKTPKRPGINYDAEATKLKAQRDALSEQLKELEGPRVMAEEQRLKQAMNAAQRSLDEYNRRIKEKDFATRGRRLGPDTKELNDLKAKRDEAKAHYEHLKDLANPKLSPEEIALKQYKARTEANIKRLERRAATGDFSKRKPAEIKLDEEAQKLKARYEQAKLNERRRVKQKELSERTRLRRYGDTLIKWQRGFILSGIKTLGKLATAAFYRLASTPIEEAVGGILGRLPGLNRIAEGAPREGGFSLRAEAKALTEGFVKGMRQFGQVIRTGKGDIDLAHGKIHAYDLDKSVMDFFGHLHAAFKNPIKEAEFSRAFEKRMRHAIDSGLDGTDPAVQMKVAAAAYGDAKGAIFMQDNAVVNGINAAIGTWERGGTTPYVLAKLTRAIIPVMRIPTNYVVETGLYVGGLATGSAKFASALLRGLDTLKPEERDLIMKHFKKGTVGGAMLLLGYLNPSSVGGYYTEREKRKPGDVSHGTFRVFGTQIPQWAAHAPIIEAMQFGATIRRVKDGMNHAHTSATGQPGIPTATAAAALGLLSEVPAFRAAETAGELVKGSSYATGELVKSFTVPQFVSDIAKASDWGNDRKMKTWDDHLKANIPGLRQTLPLKVTH